MSSFLEVDGLAAGYGRASVLHEVTLSVERGSVAVILGANGVGKTTTLRAISGLVRPTGGSIRLNGTELAGRSTQWIVSRGVSVVPEPPGVFRDLSVLDNLRAGAFMASRLQVRERLEEMFARFPLLAERAGQLGGSLSGGEQRMLAVARALMSAPQLLLVDEVSAGLAPIIAEDTFRLLATLPAQGVTVCMAEQNAGALDIADRVHVMRKGQIVDRAEGDEIASIRRTVARTYLGAEEAA